MERDDDDLPTTAHGAPQYSSFRQSNATMYWRGLLVIPDVSRQTGRGTRQRRTRREPDDLLVLPSSVQSNEDGISCSTAATWIVPGPPVPQRAKGSCRHEEAAIPWYCSRKTMHCVSRQKESLDPAENCAYPSFYLHAVSSWGGGFNVPGRHRALRLQPWHVRMRPEMKNSNKFSEGIVFPKNCKQKKRRKSEERKREKEKERERGRREGKGEEIFTCK